MREFVEQLAQAEAERQAMAQALQRIDQQGQTKEAHTQLAHLLVERPNYLPFLQRQADIEPSSAEAYRIHQKVVELYKNAYHEAETYIPYLRKRHETLPEANVKASEVYKHAVALLELATRRYLEAITEQLRCGAQGQLWEQMLPEAKRFHKVRTVRASDEFTDLQGNLLVTLGQTPIKAKQTGEVTAVLQTLRGDDSAILYLKLEQDLADSQNELQSKQQEIDGLRQGLAYSQQYADKVKQDLANSQQRADKVKLDLDHSQQSLIEKEYNINTLKTENHGLKWLIFVLVFCSIAAFLSSFLIQF